MSRSQSRIHTCPSEQAYSGRRGSAPDTEVACIVGRASVDVGAPAERKALRQRVLGGGDCVVITSYDTLRNDVDFLGGLACERGFLPGFTWVSVAHDSFTLDD